MIWYLLFVYIIGIIPMLFMLAHTHDEISEIVLKLPMWARLSLLLIWPIFLVCWIAAVILLDAKEIIAEAIKNKRSKTK